MVADDANAEVTQRASSASSLNSSRSGMDDPVALLEQEMLQLAKAAGAPVPSDLTANDQAAHAKKAMNPDAPPPVRSKEGQIADRLAALREEIEADRKEEKAKEKALLERTRKTKTEGGSRKGTLRRSQAGSGTPQEVPGSPTVKFEKNQTSPGKVSPNTSSTSWYKKNVSFAVPGLDEEISSETKAGQESGTLKSLADSDTLESSTPPRSGTASTRTCSPKSTPSTPSLLPSSRSESPLTTAESPAETVLSPKSVPRSPKGKVPSPSANNDKLKNFASTIFNAVKARRSLEEIVKGAVNSGEDPVTVMFKSPIIRNDPVMHQFLWSEIKKRMIQTFGNLENGYRAADTSNDGNINYLEFNDLLRKISIQVDARFARNLFNQASGNDRQLSFEEFKSVVMEGTLKKLKTTLRRVETNRDKIRGHIETFLFELTHGDTKNLQTSVDRFQRKLNLDFCRAFWNHLRKICLKKREREIDLRMFADTMKAPFASSSTFQTYENHMMENIFRRIDRTLRGKVHILDLATCLVLMSGETDPKKKMKLLFDVFDMDDDKCLTHHQVLLLFCSICLHRPLIIGDGGVAEADIVFNDELGLQEGRRFFELTLQHLSFKNSRQLNVTKDIVCFEELWMVFVDRPQALEALMPGTHNLRWSITNIEAAKTFQSQDFSMSKSAPGLKTLDSGLGEVTMTPTKAALMKTQSPMRSPQPWAATALLQSQSSMPLSVETMKYAPRPTTSEQYFTGMKYGFRQALRGDWIAVQDRNQKLVDHVKALHEARPNSRGQYKNSGAEDDVFTATGFPSKAVWEDWSQKHRVSLIQWVVEAQMFEEGNFLPADIAMKASQSEPSLRSNAKAVTAAVKFKGKARRPTSQQTPKAQAPGREKNNTTKASTADVTELPPIASLCWGKESVGRFQKYSDTCVRRHHAHARRTDTQNYKCQLCWTDHELKSTCAI